MLYRDSLSLMGATIYFLEIVDYLPSKLKLELRISVDLYYYRRVVVAILNSRNAFTTKHPAKLFY